MNVKLIYNLLLIMFLLQRVPIEETSKNTFSCCFSARAIFSPNNLRHNGHEDTRFSPVKELTWLL